MFVRASRLPFFALAVLAFCWFHPTPVAAGNIPFMTGTFYGLNDPFGMSADSPDGQWHFWLEAYPVEDFQWGPWTCGVTDDCERSGYGDFTGGSASGELYHWNGNSWILNSTFSGLVLPGGQITLVEATYGNGGFAWDYEYYYSLTGSWSNQWHTFASVHGWDEGDQFSTFTGSWWDMTTATP